MFAPIYEQASTTHDDVVFGKVDTEAEQALAAGSASVRSPRSWRSVRACSCSPSRGLPEPALQQLIGAVRDLDMDDVRRQVAEAEEREAAGEPVVTSG